MNGLSTIISLIVKLFSKLFRTFGINSILLLLFIIEIIICAAYVSEEADRDSERREYEFVNTQISEIDKDNPMFDHINYEPIGSEHCYLVEMEIDNNYVDKITYLPLDAEDQDENYVSFRRVDYYGDEMSGYSNECIPEATKAKVKYLLAISDYRYDETEQVRLFEYNKKDRYITLDIPK